MTISRRALLTAALATLMPGVAIAADRPTVNVPKPMRHGNWLGPQGEGSCVHSTIVYLLHWQGKHKLAEWWRTHNGDGEWDADLAAKFDRAGIRYAYTSEKGNVKFLEWALKTHRGCGITVMGGKHMIALVHLDQTHACLWDNNHPGKFKWVSRKTLIAEWLNSNSWAVALLEGPPSPPLPSK